MHGTHFSTRTIPYLTSDLTVILSEAKNLSWLNAVFCRECFRGVALRAEPEMAMEAAAVYQVEVVWESYHCGRVPLATVGGCSPVGNAWARVALMARDYS